MPQRTPKNFGAKDTKELQQKYVGGGVGKAGGHHESMPTGAQKPDEHQRMITILVSYGKSTKAIYSRSWSSVDPSLRTAMPVVK